MDLDSFIVTVYCVLDDLLRERPPPTRRTRGPAPVLADSEVLAMEAVGEFLGLDRDTALYGYFRRHYAAYFPALRRVHRTTFVRQAANLWAVKEWLWQRLLARVPHDPTLAVVDSFPLPVCRFARAPRCRRFRGAAAYGKDHVARQTFYGFRVHLRLCWPGVITRFVLAPANVPDSAAVPALAQRTRGALLGDRAYHAPAVAAHLAAHDGVQLRAPSPSAQRDPRPRWTRLLNRFRYRIETVFDQLVERYRAKQVRARDSWHLWSRLLRKVLSHTLAVLLTSQAGRPPLQLAALLTD